MKNNLYFNSNFAVKNSTLEVEFARFNNYTVIKNALIITLHQILPEILLLF